ncbi:hypothetical protein MH117_01700 [Paenibacillus sp. ACRRX]|uniref:hypothetical protein n=1 Tax=unclassified Paenibacillus TaxID=185978 RepID=UPI001EF47A94|nr:MULTISPECIES: hypothetical protein [unclassified Paenibacillus]MCG7406113.1 hypothetical protein [Paenibacillus sp. ACRRX]MDK8182568.1 hypothetical protein [Paenibacillus sp. UMB4589-SE434]
MNHWWNHFVRLTCAAALTAVVSAGLSYVIVAGSDAIQQPARIQISLPETSQTSTSNHFRRQAFATLHQESAYIPSQSISRAEAARYRTAPRLSLQETVDQTVQRLSQHQPFSAWKRAKTDVQPLGPGTHGWLVNVLSSHNKTVGYLIIHATPDDDYLLTEYGVGSRLPYDQAILSEAIHALGWEQESLDIKPLYAPPLIAMWRVNNGNKMVLLDAETGEQLPEELEMSRLDESVKRLNKSSFHHITSAASSARTGGHTSLSGVISNPLLTPDNPVVIRSTFDPYDNIQWMNGSRQLNGKKALEWLDNWKPDLQTSPWIYVQSRSYSSGTINLPYALVGKQGWTDGRTFAASYAAVSASGAACIRFIAEPLALTTGYITPVQTQSTP